MQAVFRQTSTPSMGFQNEYTIEAAGMQAVFRQTSTPSRRMTDTSKAVR